MNLPKKKKKTPRINKGIQHGHSRQNECTKINFLSIYEQ